MPLPYNFLAHTGGANSQSGSGNPNPGTNFYRNKKTGKWEYSNLYANHQDWEQVPWDAAPQEWRDVVTQHGSFSEIPSETLDTVTGNAPGGSLWDKIFNTTVNQGVTVGAGHLGLGPGYQSEQPYDPSRPYWMPNYFDPESDLNPNDPLQNTNPNANQPDPFDPLGSQSNQNTGSGTPPGAGTPPAFSSELQSILDEIRKRYEEMSGKEGQWEKDFMDFINTPTDLSRIREELTSISQAVYDQVFGRGGMVAQANRSALDDSVETGFGPSSGGFTAARQNILGQGRDIVANQIAQNGAALAGLAVQERGQEGILRGDFFKTQTGRTDSYLESLFGGTTVLENLDLARKQFEQNQKLIDQALKSGDKGWLDTVVGYLGKAGGLALTGATIYDMLGLDWFGNDKGGAKATYP